MQKIIFSGAMLFLSMLSFAQMEVDKSYTYSVSEPYRVFDAGRKLYYAKGDEAMSIKIDGKDVLIQKFNSLKPAFIGEKKYEKVFPKNFVIEGIKQVDEKYCIFYSSWDGDNDKEQLFALEIDFSKGEMNTNPKLIMRVDGKISGSMEGSYFSMRVVDKFSFFQSNDKKKLLVQYRKKPEVKNDKKSYDILGFGFINNNLDLVSSREIKMPYTERKTENLDYHLNVNGDLFMLEKVFEDDSNKDRKKKKDDPNYHLEIITLESNASEMKYTKIDLKDKFINKLWFLDSEQEKMEFGGLYNSGSKNLDDVDGIVTFSLNKQLAVENKNFIEFPVDIINLYESERSIKKNEKREAKEDEDGEGATIKNLELREMKVHPDGSKTIIGEEYYVVVHTYVTQQGTRTTYTYHYGDVYVSKVNADGKLSWMNKIPKNQVGKRGRGGMSYQYLFNNNNHYVVFLDNVKNVELPVAGKAPYKHTDGHGGYLTCVKINDNDGKSSKGSILNVREIEDFNIHQIDMDRVFQTGENSFMMEAYKKKKEDVMLKIIVN